MDKIIFLEEAKQHLRENWIEGTECPCCGQFVKKYKTNLNSSMVYALILIAKAPDGWLHVEDHFVDIGCKLKGVHGKLKHWGLIRQKPNDDQPEKNKTGYWRITQKGRDFVNNIVTVPQYVWLFNNKQYGFSENHVTIQQALGKKFNYEELMNGVTIK
mgnify:CR=1 FL=1